eukprot:TRINITY_DN2665_c0_g1_i2.p1 TRINITY_DN2665_c0_g1~~TRINITY_DN2665_c0_g1_i2.p1  ORF type:complete len:351 (+),score=74.08 TRINITY_DN2665_c0_g1_i2:139-1191(+)
MSLALLSSPKGVKFTCEICGKAAHMQCSQCRATYYCSKEHQSTDWNGIHSKICQHVQSLRAAPVFLGSENERIAYDQHKSDLQHAVIQLAKTEAQKFLLSAQYELAIPGALQALRLSVDVFGNGRTEIVPPYLLLAQATIGLRRYKQAEEYLSLAKWNVLKNPTCSDSLKSNLYRNFGKLYASQGKYKEALQQLANDLYHSSLEVGPEHIETAGGYFQMGIIFHKQSRLESALAMFDKVADIWYKFLTAPPEDEEEEEEVLDEMKGAEAIEVLQKIINIREQHLGMQHTATGESHYILGLVLQRLGRTEKALERIQKAISVYEDTLGRDHQTTVSVRKELEELEQAYFQA